MTIDRTDDTSMGWDCARGDSEARQFSISGVTPDISGFTFTLTVNKKKNPTGTSDQLFTLTGTKDVPNSKVEFKPATTDTDLAPGDYYYDIQMNDASTKKTMAKGIFRIVQDITKG